MTTETEQRYGQSGHQEVVVPIDKPWGQLEVMHIDELTQRCGKFDGQSELNNGYGCNARQNDQAPGCCYSFSCPIAVEIDDEDAEWEEGFSAGEWMKQHSEFKDA